jgi:hypothetical protein
MNERAFDRIAEAYMADGPTVLADRVLDAALDEVHLTRQRRVLVRGPWRFFLMNTYAKIALAAVVVIALGAVGLAVLRPGGSPGVGAPPAASPSPSAAPTGSPTPSPTPVPTAPALTGRYASSIHGISAAYPAGWLTSAATQPWISGDPLFRDPSADFIFDPARTSSLFLRLASQPLGDRTFDEWAADSMACAASEPTTIGGLPGSIGLNKCNVAAVSAGGRGYLILLYTSGDESWLSDVYDADWFRQVLATVQLEPDQAVDAP